jgi:hypothetical protein
MRARLPYDEATLPGPITPAPLSSGCRSHGQAMGLLEAPAEHSPVNPAGVCPSAGAPAVPSLRPAG